LLRLLTLIHPPNKPPQRESNAINHQSRIGIADESIVLTMYHSHNHNTGPALRPLIPSLDDMRRVSFSSDIGGHLPIVCQSSVAH
jgi:hypothetical protein